MLASLLSVLIAAHVLLAIALFLPSILLPFALRLSGGRFEQGPGRVSRGLFWLQRNGSLVIASGLLGTGSLLIVALGTQLLSQPWLLLGLTLYAINLALAFFIQRPGLARLLRLQPGESEEA